MAKHQEIPTLNACLRARIVLAVIIFMAVVTSPSKSYLATEKNNMIGIRTGILALDRDEFFFVGAGIIVELSILHSVCLISQHTDTI